jgi:p-aminobenzoyl-glutamate transporter AbgT
MNVQLLRQLAVRSGGAFLLPSELAQLPSLLKGHASFVSRDVRNVRERELWNWPYMLAAVVALFATEWFVRKRNGML